MGRLEESIVESLVALRDGDPGFERHMFVLSLEASSVLRCFEAAAVETVRDGEVLMVRRTDPPSP